MFLKKRMHSFHFYELIYTFDYDNYDIFKK